MLVFDIEIRKTKSNNTKIEGGQSMGRVTAIQGVPKHMKQVMAACIALRLSP